jgi:hypothetical protein
MKTVRITIANKRLVKRSKDDGYVFSTGGYGAGELFTIPKVAIKHTESALIPINDVASNEATTFVVYKWLYQKIKGKLNDMRSDHVAMPKS